MYLVRCNSTEQAVSPVEHLPSSENCKLCRVNAQPHFCQSPTNARIHDNAIYRVIWAVKV